MAATPYLLVLLIIIIINNLIFGFLSPLITLIPYLIYHIVNRNHNTEFISTHTKRAMNIFIKYFIFLILMTILAISFTGLGVGLNLLNSDPLLFVTLGVVGLILVIPLLIVTIYAIIASTLGSIRAFLLVLPNKTPWQPVTTDQAQTEAT
jgi:magnesium-transporting ATPase (P-type)